MRAALVFALQISPVVLAFSGAPPLCPPAQLRGPGWALLPTVRCGATLRSGATLRWGRKSVCTTHTRSLIRRAQQGDGAFDAEDPWDKALDALEAERRRAAAEQESANDSISFGWDGASVLLESERERQDESADWEFYDSSRLVFHADNDVFERLAALYRDLLPPGGTILDVGSSWHVPLPLLKH